MQSTRTPQHSFVRDGLLTYCLYTSYCSIAAAAAAAAAAADSKMPPFCFQEQKNYEYSCWCIVYHIVSHHDPNLSELRALQNSLYNTKSELRVRTYNSMAQIGVGGAGANKRQH